MKFIISVNYYCSPLVRVDAGCVPAQSLHSDGAAAQDPSLHRSSAAAAGCPVRRRLRSSAVSQDVLPGSTSCHVAHQVSDARHGSRNSNFTNFFSFLKFNEFYEIFPLKKIRKKFVILLIIDV